MNIKKKGASIAFTATLLASLLATVAAPLASAAVSVTSAGTVPRGSTSANPATFTFTENSAACFQDASDAPPAPLAGGELIVTIDDGTGDDVQFVGPVSVSAPGSLGATAALTSSGGPNANDQITINFADSSDFNVEQVSVSARISADSDATAGAIVATLGGNEVGCVLAATGTATGTLSVGIGPGDPGAVIVNLTGNCAFDETAPLGGSLAGNGKATFTANPESTDVEGVGGVVIDATPPHPGPGDTQSVDFDTLVNAHPAGDTVTQTVHFANCNFAIGSPGTIGDALTQTTDTPIVVNVGENNQPAATSHWDEFPNGDGNEFAGTLVFSIISPASGVTFSSAPGVDPDGGVDLGGGPGTEVPCSLSVDRMSCSVTVVSNAAVPDDEIDLEDILLDVASSVPAGTPVRVALVQTPAVPIIVVSDTIAFVGRVIAAVSAQPPIHIGFNDQESGMKTLQESGPGFFQSGVGSNNTFALCIATGETFTRAPWAVVTNSGGTPGLQLLNGVSPASQVRMTLYNGGNCAYANIYSGSTTGPATIEIRGSADNVTPLASGPNNGPRLSVPSTLAPGSEQAAIFVGDQAVILSGCTTPAGCAGDPGFVGFLSEAIRAFRNSVTVSASSQPFCPPGSTDCLLGNIVITETQNGQLKAGQAITGWFVPSSTSLRNEVFIKASTTNDLPIVSTNASSGLLVGTVTVVCPPAIPLLNICFFTFPITQQSFGPALGQITVSNIHATIANGAVLGPILMDWGNTNIVAGIPVGPPPVGQAFEAVVSNGTIGSTPVPARTSIVNGSAVGVSVAGDGTVFTASTKIVDAGDYVTWRAHMSPSLAGERVEVWMAIKPNGGAWGAWLKVTTRAVNGNGDAYFSWKTADNVAPFTTQAGRVSVRFRFAGNAQHGAFTSFARQALFQ